VGRRTDRGESEDLQDVFGESGLADAFSSS
jgi:hypothetical protein